MSQTTPSHREVWQEADGYLLLCWNPGVWIRFGSPTPLLPNDPSISYPLRRVFTKRGVPTLDDPVKEALFEDLAAAQADRDRWREKAGWLSSKVTTTAHVNSVKAGVALTDQQEEESDQEAGFTPPPTESPGGSQHA